MLARYQFIQFYWVSQKKMSVSNKGTFLTNGHFFDSPCIVHIYQGYIQKTKEIYFEKIYLVEQNDNNLKIKFLFKKPFLRRIKLGRIIASSYPHDSFKQ